MPVTDPSFNPSGDERIDVIKKRGAELGMFIEQNVPECRRRSVALTHLETALMFAVKAVVDPDE